MINDLFTYAREHQFGELHFKQDNATGLQAIIAVHSTKRGPALGGCRFIEYPDTSSALEDVMRLAKAMSYKAALVDLPLGGGKSVIIKPKQLRHRSALFKTFGQFIDQLNGKYITAVDSGTNNEDMASIAEATSFVAGISDSNDEPSPFTAHGILRGIEAAAAFKLKRDSLDGVRIAIQGLGKVGFELAKACHKKGAQLIIADVNDKNVQRCKDATGAQVVTPEEILSVDCDILSPCALGGVIRADNVGDINAKIIAGAANNQLDKPDTGYVIQQRNILYAPDFVINAAGLIYAYAKYRKISEQSMVEKIETIHPSLWQIFEQAEAKQKPTNIIAIDMAEERLRQ